MAANNEILRAFNFKLAFQPGITVAHFTEISGIGAKVTPIKYREGGNNATLITLPGYIEYADITLRYGLTRNDELFNWFMTSMNGATARRNVSIIVLDSDGATEHIRYNLTNAWVSEWRGTMLNARLQELAVESVTLVYDKLSRG